MFKRFSLSLFLFFFRVSMLIYIYMYLYDFWTFFHSLQYVWREYVLDWILPTIFLSNHVKTHSRGRFECNSCVWNGREGGKFLFHPTKEIRNAYKGKLLPALSPPLPTLFSKSSFRKLGVIVSLKRNVRNIYSVAISFLFSFLFFCSK